MIKISELNVLELFGGIGAIRKALIRQKISHKTVDYVEIDKNCVKSYNALYGEEFEPKSIVDYHPTDERIDLLMHGSPCQDFSRSGLKKGGTKGSGTRSSLLFETISSLEKIEAKDISKFLEEDVSNLYEVKQESMLSHIRGDPKNNHFKGRLKVIDKFAYTISTKQARIPNSGIIDIGNGKYRYLTERECFRLMGFDDEDFDTLRAIYKQRKGTTSSILYKQAGNSIVVDVLEAILKEIMRKKK